MPSLLPWKAIGMGSGHRLPTLLFVSWRNVAVKRTSVENNWNKVQHTAVNVCFVEKCWNWCPGSFVSWNLDWFVAFTRAIAGTWGYSITSWGLNHVFQVTSRKFGFVRKRRTLAPHVVNVLTARMAKWCSEAGSEIPVDTALKYVGHSNEVGEVRRNWCETLEWSAVLVFVWIGD